jgi:hypothetical protein
VDEIIETLTPEDSIEATKKWGSRINEDGNTVIPTPDGDVIITPERARSFLSRIDPEDILPPEAAPTDTYTETYVNPIANPISLQRVGNECGDKVSPYNMDQYRLGLPGVSPDRPVTMSQFRGKSGKFRLVGDIHLDRVDALFESAGLYQVPSRWWDKDTTTGIPNNYDSAVSGRNDYPWTSAFCNNWEWLYRLTADESKVTQITSLSAHAVVDSHPSGSTGSDRSIFRLYASKFSNGSISDATNDLGLSNRRPTVSLVTDGVPTSYVSGSTNQQKLDNLKNFILNGFLCRYSHQMSSGGRVGKITDLFWRIDCEIEV